MPSTDPVPAAARPLTERRAAVVAALRLVRDTPVPARAATRPDPVLTAELAAMRADVHRLLERVSRLEDEVELLRQEDEAPLSWPAPVESGTGKMTVPPMMVSAGSSRAYDVLLGPATGSDKHDRETA